MHLTYQIAEMRFDCFSKNKYLDAFKQQHSLRYGNTKKETKFIYFPQKFERRTCKEEGKKHKIYKIEWKQSEYKGKERLNVSIEWLHKF
jgi:hypothetical protein